MTVGVVLSTVAVDAADVLAVARAAEAAGFDAVYVGDHLVHPRPMLESLVMVSAIAATTARITVGTCVLLPALREPVLLGNQLATLAAIAPGRLRIGVGVGGEYPEEFEAAGVPMRERGARLERAVTQLRTRLPDVPFVFGGHSEAALRRAARLGDGWIGYLLGPESFARRRASLLEQRPSFRVGMLVPVLVGGSREDAVAAWQRMTTKELPERLFAAGSAAEVVAQLRSYDCDELLLAPIGSLERLATEVLPSLRA